MKDFGTSKSPKSTRPSTTHWCPDRPGHPAFRHNIASSLRLHTGLPYDWTPRSDAPLGSPLAPSARWISRVASRLPGTTRLRFTLRDQLVAGLPPAGFQTSGHGRMVHLSFFDSASRRSGQHFLNGTGSAHDGGKAVAAHHGQVREADGDPELGRQRIGTIALDHDFVG